MRYALPLNRLRLALESMDERDVRRDAPRPVGPCGTEVSEDCAPDDDDAPKCGCPAWWILVERYVVTDVLGRWKTKNRVAWLLRVRHRAGCGIVGSRS